VPARMICPVCGSKMLNRSIYAHYSWKPYRVCPDCRAKYTADSGTRSRQLLIAVFATLTLVLSIASYIDGSPWTWLTFLAGTGLLIYVGYTLSRMKYVEYLD